MSESFEPDTVNVVGLDKLLKALKQAHAPKARVGILGSKAERTGEEKKANGPSNADIGLAHEYGNPIKGLPQRSFLRVPLADHLQKDMEKSRALSEAAMKEVLKKGTVKPWLEKVAEIAVEVVEGGFDSGGYGKWAPHSPGYSNNTGQILVDTQQLRNSITQEVKE